MFFEKVSLAQWQKDLASIYFNKDFADIPQEDQDLINKWYTQIKLPKQATEGSMGHDFFNPYDELSCQPGEVFTVPTGIRWCCGKLYGDDINAGLLLLPRSGLGFKYGFQLLNTVGVIDKDYSDSDNEGHIMARVTSLIPLKIKQGKAFLQGIIIPYMIARGAESTNKRNGGFGSTDEKNN